MIQKIRNILKLDTIEGVLLTYNENLTELKNISENIQDLSIDFHNRKNDTVTLIKSVDNIDNEFLQKVVDKDKVFKQLYIDNVFKLKKQRDVILKQQKKLLKSYPEIKKNINNIENYNKIKQAYKDNVISSSQYDKILLKGGEVIKYADNIVFNENNELLILKRASNDDSHPNEWVIPGGHVDFGETFETAGKRELQEESGLFVTDVKHLGTFKDNKAHIEYFLSFVHTEEQQVVVEFKETQDYIWIEPLTELDLYKFPFNMKENIKKLLDIPINDKKQINENIEKSEKIKGGLADNKTLNDIAKKHNISLNKIKEQLKRGVKIEFEHTNNAATALEIAKDHLWEISDYYTRLEKMEYEAEGTLNKENNNSFTKNENIDILKARSGVYADTPKNRKLKRVGQKYGSKKGEEQTQPKENKKGNNNKKQEPENLIEQAKNSSEKQLQNAIKESKDSEIRQVAYNELQRRQKEERLQEEKVDIDHIEIIKEKKEELSKKYKEISDNILTASSEDEMDKLSIIAREYIRYVHRISIFEGVDKNIELDKVQEFLGLHSENEVQEFFGDGKILGIKITNTSLGSNNDSMEVETLFEDGYCSREMDKTTKVISMSEFILNPELERGGGKGSDIFFNQVNNFKKSGFEELVVEAAKSDVYNGYYTWARLGYILDEYNIDFLNLIGNSEDKDIRNVNSLSELMLSKKGRTFWKENGFAFTGSFELHDGSKSIFMLNNYMEEKKNGKK